MKPSLPGSLTRGFRQPSYGTRRPRTSLCFSSIPPNSCSWQKDGWHELSAWLWMQTRFWQALGPIEHNLFTSKIRFCVLMRQQKKWIFPYLGKIVRPPSHFLVWGCLKGNQWLHQPLLQSRLFLHILWLHGHGLDSSQRETLEWHGRRNHYLLQGHVLHSDYQLWEYSIQVWSIPPLWTCHQRLLKVTQKSWWTKNFTSGGSSHKHKLPSS